VYRTGESLLSLVFDDLELLGSNRLLRHARGCTSLTQLTIAEWADILATRFPDAVHPALRHDVERCVQASAGDPLMLLELAARHTSAQPDGHLELARFPLTVFAGTDRRTRPPLDFEVADSHLHSGASMPLSLFLQALATRAVPVRRPGEKQLLLLSATGRRWDMTVLLAACRWAMRLMLYLRVGGSVDDADRLDQWRLDELPVQAVRCGTFWLRVRAAALSPAGLGTRIVQVLNRPMPNPAAFPAIDELFARTRTTDKLVPDALTPFMHGFVRAVVAISNLLTSRPGEGLSRFVERFDMMGAAKNAALKDESWARQRVQLVEWTLRRIAPSTEVAGAELRKTIASLDAGAFRKEVRTGLHVHNAAFAQFTHDERPASLTMPVGFQRFASARCDPSESGPTELQHVLAGCDALRQISDEEGGTELMNAIWSIDVANEEIGSANWPFVIGAEILARHVRLTFTIHAGESFVSQLNGVRRVGQLFMGAVPPKRIGHALALDEQAAEQVLARGCPPIIRSEAIMDLAWVVHEGLDMDHSAASLLRNLVAAPSPDDDIHARDWVAAFADLHRYDSVAPRLIAGLDPSDPLGGHRVVSERRRYDDALGGTPVDRAMAGLAWGAPPAIAGCDVSTQLTCDQRRDYFAVTGALAPRAREHVLAKVKGDTPENAVVIESCPTSNVRLAGLDGYASHPLWDWHTKGIAFSISSDDPLLLGATVLDEYAMLRDVGRDEQAVRAAAAVSVATCSGGDSRPAGWERYGRVFEILTGKPYEPRRPPLAELTP
jgi:hypothetical protein